MAFPQIGNTAVTNGTTATGTPVVNLPANIAAGNLLLVLMRGAVAGAIGWPDAGWVELFDASPDASDDQTALAWRAAIGDEGATITLTITSAKFAAVAWRITGAEDPTVQPPELSTVATGGVGQQPDPTTVTPTGGAKDYLYGAICAMEGEATDPPTSFPTNYTLGPISAGSGAGGAVTTNVRVAGAWRELNAASADPGAFTYGGTMDDWLAYAVAIHPAPAAVVPEIFMGTTSAPLMALAQVGPQNTVGV